jgi:hypothetical protein
MSLWSHQRSAFFVLRTDNARRVPDGYINESTPGHRGHQAAISAAPRSSGAHSASPSELDLPTDRDRPVARQPEVLSGLG